LVFAEAKIFLLTLIEFPLLKPGATISVILCAPPASPRTANMAIACIAKR